MRRSLAALLAVLLVASFAAAPARAKDKPAPPPPPPADKPYGDWKKLLKDSDTERGFLTLHRKRENLYLELKPSELDRPFLEIGSFARGIGSNGLLGGLPIGDQVLQFRRSGDHVLLEAVDQRFTAPAGTPIAAARDLSIGNSVVASLKIEAEQDSTKVLLVDLAPVVVSDVTDLGERMRYSFGGKSVRFDPTRSVLGRTRSFPDNTEIEAQLTYSPNDRTNFGISSVPDDRYIPIAVHYSFSRLPETPMPRRWADDRVGYFMQAQKDFSRDEKDNFFLRYVNRWRLVKKDSSAALSEPVKPIVYYIDRTVPEKYRPWVKEGIEGWQKAFEAAGFKNAIVARDAPDDSTYDPEDVRWSTIRWITSSEPSFGAIGPSRVDPRTGEILDADILFEASLFQSYRNIYRRYVGPQDMAASILPWTTPAPAGAIGPERCDAGLATADGEALERMALLVDGTLPPGSPVPDAYLHETVVSLVMHEVGHTLGLRHNFRASTSTPMDKLDDVAWTKANGLSSSVMDYPAINVSPDRTKQGQYWTTAPGTYDVWAIRYGYTPTAASDPDADYAKVRAIADESLRPGHEYSTDEDTYSPNSPDPRSNIFDLGGDPLAFARERSAYVAGLWRNPRYEERIVGDSGDLQALRNSVNLLLGQYGTALGFAVKYVGGSYVTRVHRGQPGEVDPVVPVPAPKQREALDFLAKSAFAADAFAISPKLLQRLMPDRWAQWGGADTYGRVDFAWHDRVLAIQTALVEQLTTSPLLARLRESESRAPDAFRTSELFDRLTNAIWGEVGPLPSAGMKALAGTGTRRELQRAWVDRLDGMVTGNQPGLPDDARALARLQLSRLDARAARALTPGAGLADDVRAHLVETRARIKRALEAHAEADAPMPVIRGPFGAPTAGN